ARGRAPAAVVLRGGADHDRVRPQRQPVAQDLPLGLLGRVAGHAEVDRLDRAAALEQAREDAPRALRPGLTVADAQGEGAAVAGAEQAQRARRLGVLVLGAAHAVAVDVVAAEDGGRRPHAVV